MDREAAELTVRTYLTEVRTRLDKAAGIARAADACAGAGFSDKAVEITLDIEQPLYEATTLLNAVSLINPSEGRTKANPSSCLDLQPR
jgi:hypothetical protein